MFSTSIARTLAYRASFVVEVLVNSVWLVFFLFIIEVLFRHTESVAGWGKGEMVIMMGMWSLWDEIMQMFVGKGMRALSLSIDRGDFDLVLVKPVDAMFLSTFSLFDLARAVYAVFDIAIIGYGVSLLPQAVAWSGILGGMAMLVVAVVLGYSLWVMTVTLSFHFIHIDNIHELFHSLMMLGRNPIEIFGFKARPFLFTIIPLALIANVPSRVLFDMFAWWHVTISITTTLFFLIGARLLWNWTIKTYASASS